MMGVWIKDNTVGNQTEATEILQQALARYSQKELAQLLDKSAKTISRWENGTTPPPSILVPAPKQILSLEETPAGKKVFLFADFVSGSGGIRLGFVECGGSGGFTSR